MVVDVMEQHASRFLEFADLLLHMMLYAEISKLDAPHISSLRFYRDNLSYSLGKPFWFFKILSN